MTRIGAFGGAPAAGRAGGTVWMWGLTAGFSLAMSCAKDLDGILASTTKGGTTIREVVGDEPTAVLVYPASTCFSCGSALTNWKALAEAKRLKILVALAGTVSDADLRNLRIQRIRAVELSDNPSPQPVFVPSEYVLLGGRVIQKASGEKQIRKRRLWRIVDADTVRFPGSMISERMSAGAPR